MQSATRQGEEDGGGGNAVPTLPFVRLSNISKSFGSVSVLEDVSFEIRPGEVVGLLGENGAGKSTLMKIVSGEHAPDGGRVEIEGSEVQLASVGEGIARGISFVHQELSVVGALSVAENLSLGDLPRNRMGFVDRSRMRELASERLARIGAQAIRPEQETGLLRAGEQQLVEIARAAARNPKLLILDEPTSSLTPREVESFIQYVETARSAGTAIIFITHRLDEAIRLCDRILVLRNGEIVSEKPSSEVTRDGIISDMTGKPAMFEYARTPEVHDRTVLSLRSVGDGDLIEDITLDVAEGEILGLFGLVGAGRTELLETIFGARRMAAGRMEFCGERAQFAKPTEAMTRGMAIVPEGRKTAGILPQHSVRSNMSISSLGSMSPGGIVDRTREASQSSGYRDSLSIRMADDRQLIGTLSGGNQQKVLFARALMTNPKLLLLDEPTHGVDVGAKSEIYEIISNAADQGLAVIMASSEIPEIMALCDRVAVLSLGRLVGIVDRAALSEQRLLSLAFEGHV
ncbi:MAG: ABC transporter [Rhizobiales bacterium]|nr:ABC transporter [Hyphomicrobiales bacterium]MBA68724.1 ABC transporter [Hyphomicrobiales bacterium]|tara:strand:+ start:2260 stop:3810 length:1551 start_codon:yes stop_codon:yes gene_type:complete